MVKERRNFLLIHLTLRQSLFVKICKNLSVIFSVVCWLSVYVAAFQWLSARIDLIFHSCVAEKKVSHYQLPGKVLKLIGVSSE